MLAERCYQALDHDRIEFHDLTGRCAIASAGAAAMGLGVCVLAAPEIIVGAVVVAGVVVVGFAISEALDTYAEKKGRPQVRPVPETRPAPEVKPVPETRPAPEVKPAPETRPVPETATAPQQPSPKKRPKPEPAGQDWPPPLPPEVTERDRRPECEPRPVNHRGGHDPHNECADKIPNNSFPGWDVRVNGKDYDGLQLATLTLWDVKTDNFDKHSPHSQKFFARMKLPELQREKRLAEACGYNFVVGVKSAAHKFALEKLDPNLNIEIMDWC
ncbi:DUF6310 domain-containing protein [Archangium violaceum]|uniref:DUF6310 domain-containing protein n=1 Tax=Archangium violaceum TaxID=83451 RepID=UPI0037C039BF